MLYDHANETIRVIEEAEITIEFTREMSVSSAINSPVNLLNASAAQNWNKPAEAVYSKSDRLQSDSPQNFAKITIETEGAYYLSAADLTALGIGTSRVAAEKVKIYGYGGNIMDAKPESGQYKELPEQSVVRTYDAIGNIDKIIFYAQPAKGLYRNGSKIEKFINPYSAKSYYFDFVGGDEKRQNWPSRANIPVRKFRKRPKSTRTISMTKPIWKIRSRTAPDAVSIIVCHFRMSLQINYITSTAPAM